MRCHWQIWELRKGAKYLSPLPSASLERGPKALAIKGQGWIGLLDRQCALYAAE